MVETLGLLKEILLYYEKYRIKVISCFVTNIMVGVTNIVSPILLLKIFDEGIESKNIQRTLIYSSLFVAIAIVNVSTDLLYSKLSILLERNMATDLRLKLIKRLEKYNGTFFSEIDNGELYTLLYSDVERIPVIITGQFLNLIKNILTLLGLGVFLSSLNYKLLGILILFQVLIIRTQAKYNKEIEFHNEEFRDELIEKNKVAQDIVYNYIWIIGANLLEYTYKRINNSENNYNKKWRYLSLKIKKNDIVLFLLNTVMIASILAFGGIQVINGTLSMGALITFNIFSQRFCNPIIQIYKFPSDIIDAKISWNKIKKQLISEKTMVDVHTNYSLHGDIELVNVNYAYGKKEILSNCSISIPSNKSYAIIGKSGAGKSTMAKLLYRILEVNDGDILIDGHSIKTIGIENIRNQISYISQEVYIFNGTLRENLNVRNNISDEEIIETLKKVSLFTWFSRLENGLETNMGDNGIKISGGEKQRLALARAVLRSSNIIILDESTSMLDEITESKIVDLIYSIFKDKTILMITHKKALAKKLDNIIEVNNGNIKYVDKRAI
ncbi:MAG: ABC transporter ATP-binding protein [Pseudobutyrivibrio sp.]|uniref:ABC transporter ATP-binding protein n=1 Tax=Pseudobutyrivibrio sp. TaxID=2014367 RepID=UPI0025D9EA79|nr:ABC transporter ATP-binding protein [Pseudobutyrivibrio sp.]MBE5903531.1 ABC transporter ATP-binding protein [Pseudobutyrivibrio sp.]